MGYMVKRLVTGKKKTNTKKRAWVHTYSLKALDGYGVLYILDPYWIVELQDLPKRSLADSGESPRGRVIMIRFLRSGLTTEPHVQFPRNPIQGHPRFQDQERIGARAERIVPWSTQLVLSIMTHGLSSAENNNITAESVGGDQSRRTGPRFSPRGFVQHGPDRVTGGVIEILTPSADSAKTRHTPMRAVHSPQQVVLRTQRVREQWASGLVARFVADSFTKL